MAATDRTPFDTVIDRLFAEPSAFTLIQAARLLERWAGGVAVGYQGPPQDELLRFRAWPSLGFPRAAVMEIERREHTWRPGRQRIQITTNELGLYGADTPLPLFYTERIIQPGDFEEEDDRERLRAFLDIFQHRLLSLLYRSSYKYRYHLNFVPGGTDIFSGFLRCLIGLGTRGTPENQDVPNLLLVRYAGLMTQRRRSADGLRAMVTDFFDGLGTHVTQCIERWFTLDRTNRLGAEMCGLGEDAVIGARVLDRTGKFRLTLGPMGYARFESFLPGAPAMRRLRVLVRVYLLDDLEFDVELWLRGQEVPGAQLGSSDRPARLGWTGWLASRTRHDRRVVFNVP